MSRTRFLMAGGGTQPSEAASPPPAWALIAGGGTAGHVLPGISIGREVIRRGAPRQAVHFVGTTRGIETRLVVEAGFTLTTLPGRGLRRGLTPCKRGRQCDRGRRTGSGPSSKR